MLSPKVYLFNFCDSRQCGSKMVNFCAWIVILYKMRRYSEAHTSQVVQ